MTRPLRIEFPGAVCHVTSRGDLREPIFVDDHDCHFVTPHHLWERGTNENTNGLIRQYIPKGIDMVTLTQQDRSVIATKLNTRPRKRLDYETPHECFYAH